MTNPHIILNKPDAEYHGDLGAFPQGVTPPTFSASFIGDMARTSPGEAVAKLSEPDSPTDAMLRGRALHALVLRDDQTKIAVLDYDSYRTKEAKAARDDALASGAIPIKREDYETIYQPIVDAFQHENYNNICNLVRPQDAEKEASVYWTNQHGVNLRARLDIMPTENQFRNGLGQTDYKTTADTNGIEGFKRNYLTTYDGLLRFAHYTLAILAAHNVWANYWLLIQSMNAPYVANLAMINIGHALREQVLKHQTANQQFYIAGRLVTLEQTPEFFTGFTDADILQNPTATYVVGGNEWIALLQTALILHDNMCLVIANSLQTGEWPLPSVAAPFFTPQMTIDRAVSNLRGVRRDAQTGHIVPLGYAVDPSTNQIVMGSDGVFYRDHNLAKFVNEESSHDTPPTDTQQSPAPTAGTGDNPAPTAGTGDNPAPTAGTGDAGAVPDQPADGGSDGKPLF